MGVHSDCQDFRNCEENGLNGSEFVLKGMIGILENGLFFSNHS